MYSCAVHSCAVSHVFVCSESCIRCWGYRFCLFLRFLYLILVF